MIKNIFEHNEVYKNIFSDDQIKSIYNVIKDDSSSTIVQIYAQKVWFVDMPEDIKNQVKNFIIDKYGINLKLEEIAFARYSKQYGKLPNLTPHYDNTFLEPRITFDIQLKGNIDWPIVVENKKFILKNNEALTFSGTNQIHWREHVRFNNEDFIDMLFCHFSLPDKKTITIEEKIKTERKMMQHTNDFYQSLLKQLGEFNE